MLVEELLKFKFKGLAEELFKFKSKFPFKRLEEEQLASLPVSSPLPAGFSSALFTQVFTVLVDLIISVFAHGVIASIVDQISTQMTKK